MVVVWSVQFPMGVGEMPPWCQQFHIQSIVQQDKLTHVCTLYIDGWKPSMSHLSSAVDTNYVPRWKSFQSVLVVYLSNFCSLTGLEYPRLLSMLFSLLVSQISIKSLLLFWARGETDLTWSRRVRKSKISASHCCLTVSSLQAALCSPVSCLLRTPDSWIRLLPLLLRVQCSAPAQSGPGAGLNYFARDLRPPRNIELYKDIIC